MSGTGDARIRVVSAKDAEDLSAIRLLLREYAEWLVPIVTHSTIEAELASLPEPFVAPSGRLLGGAAEPHAPLCGMVGLKRHSDTECEIKRLFVRESCRGTGLGSALFASALDAACERGYTAALVTTIPSYMPLAAEMYDRLGFAPTQRFEDHTHAGIELRYLRLDLGDWCA